MGVWRIRSGMLCLVTAVLAGPAALSTFAGDLVQWTDENGLLHFSDSLSNVPAKYRGQAKLEQFKEGNVLQRAHPQKEAASSNGRVPENGVEKPKLNSYEVPFEAYEGSAHRVIVSVTFNSSVTVPMLMDTGAPGLVISNQLAKRLGLFENDEGMVMAAAGGIGGSVPAIRTFIDKVQVGGAKDSFIPAMITGSISRSFEGLIGMDFMSKYSFKIDPVKQVLIFEELPHNPNLPGGRSERWWRGLFKELRSLRAAWKNHAAQVNGNPQQREFAGRQVSEADKLLSKLERHASEHFVPQDWR